MAHTPGIGRLIGSPWPTRPSLTKGSGVSLAMSLWFWGGAEAAEVTPMSALAEVSTGWYGEVVMTAGGLSAVAWVPWRSSAVELLERLSRAARRLLGVELRWALTSTGLVSLEADDVFSFECSGSLGARLGFAGIQAGASSYLGASAAYGVIVPSIGLRLDGAEVGVGGGVSLAAPGSGDALPGLTLSGDTGTLTVYGSFAELTAWELDGTHDVALLGSWGGRVKLTGQRRRPWGARPGSAYLEHDVTAVRL